MCVQCVAQGAAYVGVGLVGLRTVGWRARRRSRGLVVEGPSSPTSGAERDVADDLADATT